MQKNHSAATYPIALVITLFCVFMALEPVGWWPLGVVALTPLIWGMSRSQSDTGALYGGAFGALLSSHIFLGAFAYHVGLGCLIVIATSLAFAAFGACVPRLAKANAVAGPVLCASLWVGVELLLHSLGVPIGYGALFAEAPWLLASASIGGQHLVAWLFIAAQFALVMAVRNGRRRRFVAVAAVVLLTVCSVFGHWHLRALATDHALSAVAIQTDHHPSRAFDLAAENTAIRIAQQRRALAETPPPTAGPTLVVWPESGTTGLALRVHGTGDGIHGAHQLHNAIDVQASGAIYQATFGLLENGEIVSRRSKRRKIPLLEAHYSVDPKAAIHTAIHGRPGSLICYESVFAQPSLELARQGAGVLAISTNDAYAGPSFLYAMHRGMTPLRAIETGRPIIRAANGAGSAIFDRFGRRLSSSKDFASATLSATVQVVLGQTLYSSTANVWRTLFALLALAAVVVSVRIRTSVIASPIRPQGWRRLCAAVVLAGTALAGLQIGVAQAVFKRAHDTSGFVGRNYANQFGLGDANYDAFMVQPASVQRLEAVLAFALGARGVATTASDINKQLVPNGQALTISAIDGRELFGFELRLDRSGTPPASRYPWLASLKNGDIVAVRYADDTGVEVFSALQGVRHLDVSDWRSAWNGWTLRLIPVDRHWDDLHAD